jgi:hypothetical protein
MKTRLELAIPGEASRYHALEHGAVVGSGDGSDVVLDAPGVAAHHFRIELGARRLELKVAPGAGPLCYEGKRFKSGKINYGRDFYLAQVRFNCAVPARTTSPRRALWLALGIVLVTASAALALTREHDGAATRASEDPVELFGPAAPCAEQEPARARRRAERLERAARAKEERRRYDPHDGVEAGRLYAEATACFDTASDAAGRERNRERGSELRARVQEELRAARLRLRAALTDQRQERALLELAALRRLMKNEPHRYARWLQEKERALRSTPAR